MKASHLFATFLLLLPNLHYLSMTLQDALKSNKVKVKLTSNGNSLEEGMINAEISNVSITRLDLILPVGTKLNAFEDYRQNLIVVQEEVFALAPNSKKLLQLKGMCIQASNSSPGADAVYSLGEVLQGDILDCAKMINQKKIINSCGQEAIWALSDNHDVGWINASSPDEKALRQFVADKKKVENPWFTTSYDAGNNQLSSNYNPTLPVVEHYSRTSAEIRGDFKWKQTANKQLTFAVYDAQGNVVRKFFENKPFERGELTFKFHYKTTKNLNGTYYARMTCGSEIVQEEAFTF